MASTDKVPIDTLPALPYLAHEVMLAVNEKDPSTAAVAEALAREPGLSARVVAMANAAQYAHRPPVYAIDDAVARLGLKRVRALAASVLLARVFDPSHCAGFDAGRFWRASIATAFTAARLSPYIAPEEDEAAAYLGGLLHNIGLLLLAHAFPLETGAALREESPRGNATLGARLVARLGRDHRQAGALLLEAWHVPSPLVHIAAHCGDGHYRGPHAQLVRAVRESIQWRRRDYTGTPEGTPAAPLRRIATHCLAEQEEIEAFAQLLT